MLAFRDLPPHLQLLLLAARTHPTEEELEASRRLAAGPLNWQLFVQLCDHHRLSSLIFESPAALFFPVHAELQTRATANAFEALRAVHELRRIVSAFTAAGLGAPAILKGVPLSQLLFANPNARHVGDLDLLTPAEHLPEKIELLAQLGYQRTNPPGVLTPRRLASYVSFWKDFTFRNPDSGFELDLHWRLFNNRFHPANRLLDGTCWTTVTAFGLPMRTLSLPDQFLYIAAHGSLDAWTYLKSLADLAASLRMLPLADLDQALTRAQHLNLLPQISGAIYLANDWMGTGIDHPLLLSASPPAITHVRRRTAAMLLRQNFLPERSFPSPARWLLLELRLVPGFRSLVEVTRRFLWRPRVWSKVDLPDRFFWLYPLLALMLPPRMHSVEDGPVLSGTDLISSAEPKRKVDA